MLQSSDNVIAKLIENWWTNANERSFQYQFAFQLMSDGFDILHITRHCGMEFGKDIIARSPEGDVHCYQLKSGFGERLKLSDWQKMSSQVDDLVALPIKHPSLDGGGVAMDHQPWFVVNGYLNEEVQRQIDDRNATYRNRFDRELKTVVLGEMVGKSVSTANSVWPTNPELNHELFSAYISDGRKPLDRSTFFEVLQAMIPADIESEGERSLRRIADSIAVVTSLYTANMAKQQNWIAQIEAWTICWAFIASLFERRKLDPSESCLSMRLIEVTLASLLQGLADEVSENPELRSRESVANNAYGVSHVRTTLVLGYLSVNAIRQLEQDGNFSDAMSAFKSVLRPHAHLELWGEAAIPSLLAYWLAQQHHDATCRSDRLLLDFIDALLGKLSSRQVYPDPYVLADEFAIAAAKKDGTRLVEMRSQRESFWLGTLVETTARQLLRQSLAQRWSDLSRISYVRFETPATWQYLLWRSKKGTYVAEHWPEPTSWDWLRDLADRSGEELPISLRKQAWLTLLFMVVFPHRALPSALSWAEKRVDSCVEVET